MKNTSIEIINGKKTILKQELHINPFASEDGSDHDEDTGTENVPDPNILQSIQNPHSDLPMKDPIVFVPKLHPLSQNSSLAELDQEGYRAIWTSLTHRESYAMESVAEIRIRMHEETKPSKDCKPGSEYYEKCMNVIDTMKLKSPYNEKPHLQLSGLVLKLFFEEQYFQHKIEECGREILNFVKIFIGDQFKNNFLQVLTFTLFQCIRKKRRDIYKSIKSLVLPMT